MTVNARKRNNRILDVEEAWSSSKKKRNLDSCEIKKEIGENDREENGEFLKNIFSPNGEESFKVLSAETCKR